MIAKEKKNNNETDKILTNEMRTTKQRNPQFKCEGELFQTKKRIKSKMN